MLKHIRCIIPRTLLLTLAFFLCAPTAGSAAEEKKAPKPLTVKRIFASGEFNAKGFPALKWVENKPFALMRDKSETQKNGTDLYKYHLETGKKEVLVSARGLIPAGASKPLSLSGYDFSKDMKKLLIYTNTRRVWRINTRGDYWVLDRETGSLRKLGGDAEEAMLMFAKLSPSGDRAAYVYKNNIYVQDLDTFTITQLTDTASEFFINGTSDWVNEEEFHLRDGFRWSPAGKHIAYWQFNTKGVNRFTLINYTKGLYPELKTFPYPKTGERNSLCRVGVIPATGGETRWMQVPGDPRNNYIPRMQWHENSRELILQQLNRLQNRNTILRANAATGEVKTVLIERDDAWVDLHGGMHWLKDGRHFTWLSERDGWNHLYRVDADNKHDKLLRLTPGDYDVVNLLKVDEKRNLVYFIASPANPTQRYLYKASLKKPGTAKRITPKGENGVHSYNISPDGQWAIHSFSSFGVPPVTELIRLPSHKQVRMLEDNSELRKKLAKLETGPRNFFRVPATDGVTLDGWCIKPPGFQEDKKYPLLFYVYGEPAGQTAKDQWGGGNYLWYLMLAQRGYIIANMDNRGTPAPRGRAWRKCIYEQVGILASKDQAAATRNLLKRWKYIDPERIGIWGWSGGGSMSLNAIFRYPDIYNTAMAIAFISNERFYDTIYQERYMGLPAENPEGYLQGSPATHAKNLKGNLLLVYGTGDDNCHYQNCEFLVNKLIELNKPFTMMAYPNRTHSIREGKNTRLHLFELLTRYLMVNMPPGAEKNT